MLGRQRVAWSATAFVRRLLNGWTIRRIAKDLCVSVRAVLNHERAICQQESVPDRHALAAKLASPHAQPLNQVERAQARRARVREMLLLGRSYQEMMRELDTDFPTVNRDTAAIYKTERVSGRRGLLKKLGITLETNHTRTRDEIRQRRKRGETWRQIAKEMGLNFWTVDHHAKEIRRGRRAGHVAAIGSGGAR